MKKLELIIPIVTILVIVASVFIYAATQGIAVLDPQGLISSHQRDLFVLAISMGLFALLPVFVITSIVVHRYHFGNKSSVKRYKSTWEVKPEASWIWAAFVVVIITTLSVIMIRSTYAIDPHRPIKSSTDPLTVRVVALQWKWLFIYPEENIAVVNELVIPENTPVTFELTADAPMSSFWVPKLGGMIYAMEGMVTHLNLAATSTGVFEGLNTEINGEGYSGMKFKTRAVTQAEYAAWVSKVKETGSELSMEPYKNIARPSSNHPVEYFAYADPNLFGQILAKFMNPTQKNHESHNPTSH